jgi:hypothetical protein
MIRAQRPTQLFGLVQEQGMTTLAVPRSLRTSAMSICHALIDANMDHRATSLKIQGYFMFFVGIHTAVALSEG